MIRLLCIINKMDQGGAETFIMKVYRKLDKSKYQIDFCVASSEKGYYDDEILSMGGIIYYGTGSKGRFKGMKKLKCIISDGGYSTVLRMSSNAISCLDLIVARSAGCKNIAVRSASSNCDSTVQKVLHYFFRPLLSQITTIKIAPSDLAATWMFGESAVKNGKVIFLNNALDTTKFDYNEEKRTRKRLELGLSSNFVVGHIGRFNEVKNHKFLIKVFTEIKKRNENAVLLLIGTGPLKEDIREYACHLNVLNDISFFEFRNDITEMLQAMDVFVFPSLYEGMPNALIEAQASGLKCFASDTITDQADVTGLVEYISLLAPVDGWASKICQPYYRQSTKGNLDINGYNIENLLEVFTDKLYMHR